MHPSLLSQSMVKDLLAQACQNKENDQQVVPMVFLANKETIKKRGQITKGACWWSRRQARRLKTRRWFSAESLP